MDILLVALHEGMERTLEFDTHGHGALHDTLAVAVGAVRVEGAGDAFLGALAGHLHEAERGDREHVGAGLIASEAVAHPLVDGLLILPVLHVDKVNDDESADIA